MNRPGMIAAPGKGDMMAKRAIKTGNPVDYRLDEQVGFILRRASQRHQIIFGNEIPDLTATQFAALAKLFELGPVSQNELGRQTAMDAATIKGVIDRLRKRGHVATRPDPDDMRRLYVEISPDGIKAFAGYATAALRISEQTLAPLGVRERMQFLQLLDKIANGPVAPDRKGKS